MANLKLKRIPPKKAKKVYSGTNVRIDDAVYKKVSDFATKNGFKIGKFFEMAAVEKIKNHL